MNGDAQLGPADGSGASPVTIPGWTKIGSPDVLTYASGLGVQPGAGDLAPINGGKNYFSGGPGPAGGFSEIMQTIDLSGRGANIDAGSVTCSFSAYLGGAPSQGSASNGAILYISFKDASSNDLLQSNLSGYSVSVSELAYRAAVSLVPAGARSIVVRVHFGGGDGPSRAFADNLSLVLTAPAPPESVLGRNLVTNGDAEAGPASAPNAITPDVPGWQRFGDMSVQAYSDPKGLQPTATGLAIPGKNFFWGGPGKSGSVQSFQVYDVSAAASLIDTGQVTYTLSGWLGGIGTKNDFTNLMVFFEGWNTSLAQGILQGPLSASARQNQTQMLFRSVSDRVPPGTRKITLKLWFQSPPGFDIDPPFGLADSISLLLSSTGIPSTRPAIVRIATASAFGALTPIAPGSWIEIYGYNLATNTRQWTDADFGGKNPPIILDGTFVVVGNGTVPVYFISPTQVNAYLPLNAAGGLVDITVRAPSGTSGPFTVSMNETQPGLLAPPSFVVQGKQYAVAVLPDGFYALPTGALPGVNARPSRPGETVVLYGIGFGRVSPAVDDAQVISAQNTLMTPLEIFFGSTSASIVYQGFSPGSVGLYQFNVVVPPIPDGDAIELSFKLGGKPGQQSLVTAVRQ